MATTVYVNGRGCGQIAVDGITTLVIGVLANNVTPQPGESTDGVPYTVTRAGMGVIQTGFLRGDGVITIKS